MSEKNKIVNSVLGTDPELFLYSELEAKFVPVCGLVGGTKEVPLPVVKDNPMFAVQEDNVALEFTIPPASNLNDWLSNINFMKNYISNNILNPLKLVPNYSSSARFKEEDLQSKAAQHMGCSTSYNAWTFTESMVERDDVTLRTTGMHIHVGYENPHPDYSIELVRAMDIFLGVPSILLDPDIERRKMYGKAGDYRIKNYGVEYRSLGGFFLSSDELLKWCYESTMKAIEFVNSGSMENITDPDRIQECINTCNKDLANEIIEDYRIEILNYETV